MEPTFRESPSQPHPCHPPNRVTTAWRNIRWRPRHMSTIISRGSGHLPSTHIGTGTSTPWFLQMMWMVTVSPQTCPSRGRTGCRGSGEERARPWLHPHELVLGMFARSDWMITASHWEISMLSFYYNLYGDLHLSIQTECHLVVFHVCASRCWSYKEQQKMCSVCGCCHLVTVGLQDVFQLSSSINVTSCTRWRLFIYTVCLAIKLFCTMWTDKYLYIGVIHVDCSFSGIGVILECVYVLYPSLAQVQFCFRNWNYWQSVTFLFFPFERKIIFILSDSIIYLRGRGHSRAIFLLFLRPWSGYLLMTNPMRMVYKLHIIFSDI